MAAPLSASSSRSARWVSVWGSAVSVAENRPERYAKDVTLRYPIHMPPSFSGDAVRITWDNFTGTEPITIAKATVLCRGVFYAVSFGGGDDEDEKGSGSASNGAQSVAIPAGGRVVSVPIAIEIPRREGQEESAAASTDNVLYVSFYLKDFTLMRSVVFARGPLSEGLYANGDETTNAHISPNTSRKTNLFYFLSNVSLLTTDVRNRSIVCFGDSITAQNWPDDLSLRCAAEGFGHTAIVRRATSGSRILRQYDCILYESYGLKGSLRFPREVPTDGADAIIIQQGINDIIHPVGTAENIFRPMSDLPTAEALIEGLKAYIAMARSYGLKVYVGTLLPMGGWRTDAPFRQALRHAYNDFVRTTPLINGCIDFDKALRDPSQPDRMLPAYDTGDHLHPNARGYKRMAAEVPVELLRGPLGGGCKL